MKGKAIGGIILAGGKSSRMGVDKGLIEYRGKKLVDYSIDLLYSYCSDIVISTNQPGYEATGLKLVADKFKDVGPLGGLHAALSESMYEWNLVVGCDMPFLHPEIIDELLGVKGDYEVIIPSHVTGNEPLIGLYKKDLANYFQECICKNELKLQQVIKNRNVFYLDVDALLYKYPLLFHNLNNQGDMVNI